MEMIAVYVNHANQENADKVTHHLFQLKLIAGVNSFPINSTYFWEGKIGKSEEIVTIYQTKSNNRIKIKDAIESVHTYKVPSIMKINCEVNTSYGNWIMENVK